MLETKVLTFRASSSLLPDVEGASGALDINLYLPATVERIGEGWEPISHTLTPIGETDVLLTVLVRREVTIPESLA